MSCRTHHALGIADASMTRRGSSSISSRCRSGGCGTGGGRGAGSAARAVVPVVVVVRLVAVVEVGLEVCRLNQPQSGPATRPPLYTKNRRGGGGGGLGGLTPP